MSAAPEKILSSGTKKVAMRPIAWLIHHSKQNGFNHISSKAANASK